MLSQDKILKAMSDLDKIWYDINDGDHYDVMLLLTKARIRLFDDLTSDNQREVLKKEGA